MKCSALIATITPTSQFLLSSTVRCIFAQSTDINTTKLLSI